MPEWSTPELRPDWCEQMRSSFSRTITRLPRRWSLYAAARPTIPPPMTTTSADLPLPFVIIFLVQALDAAPQVDREVRVAMDGHEIAAGEEAQLRCRRGPWRERVEHERLADRVAMLPLVVGPQHDELLR